MRSGGAVRSNGTVIEGENKMSISQVEMEAVEADADVVCESVGSTVLALKEALEDAVGLVARKEREEAIKGVIVDLIKTMRVLDKRLGVVDREALRLSHGDMEPRLRRESVRVHVQLARSTLKESLDLAVRVEQVLS